MADGGCSGADHLYTLPAIPVALGVVRLSTSIVLTCETDACWDRNTQEDSRAAGWPMLTAFASSRRWMRTRKAVEDPAKQLIAYLTHAVGRATWGWSAEFFLFQLASRSRSTCLCSFVDLPAGRSFPVERSIPLHPPGRSRSLERREERAKQIRKRSSSTTTTSPLANVQNSGRDHHGRRRTYAVCVRSARIDRKFTVWRPPELKPKENVQQ